MGKKLVFFLQTHKNENQILKLVQTLKKSHSTEVFILIDHDYTTTNLSPDIFSNIENVHILKGKNKRYRGDFSLIDPYFRAITYLDQKKVEYSWLIYLSGQDYPLISIDDMATFLESTPYEGFIKFTEASTRWKENNQKRYLNQYIRIPNSLSWILKPLLVRKTKIENNTPIKLYPNYGPVVGLPARTTPFSESFKLYRGHQWHTLSKTCVDYIRVFAEKNPKVIKYFKKTMVPDEAIIQTILVNSNTFNLCNDHKRFFTFKGSQKGHPRFLTPEDFREISPKKYHFARKIDENIHPGILEMIDKTLTK